jgi:hypothetical protein
MPRVSVFQSGTVRHLAPSIHSLIRIRQPNLVSKQCSETQLPGLPFLVFPDLRPPVDVDHELGEDLRGGVVQPEPPPDRREVRDGVHHLQHPARGLPVLAEGLQSAQIYFNSSRMIRILGTCSI